MIGLPIETEHAGNGMLRSAAYLRPMFARTLVFASLAVASSASAQDASSLMAEVRRALGAFRACVIDETVRLGRGNTESAETVLRAVSARCLGAENDLYDAYGATPISETHRARLMRRDRVGAENDATLALLEARASN